MTEPDDYRELMKEALIQLDSLQSELDSLRRAKSEPIAVVGVGCRFPGHANDPDSFWNLLRDGVDAVQEIPRERWDLDAFYDPDPDAPGKVYCRHAALVDQQVIEQFNPEFFCIAPREAERMDPQQRTLLEVCWETLENAAIPPSVVRGSRTGLFVGSCTDDYLQLFNNLTDPSRIDGYSSLGTARCITVGRIAYILGLVGPVVQLDTACSSSLVAVHQACASLRNGESDMAFAGGVNLQLSPVWTLGLCKLKALSPDGRCKTFDAQANGFVRGEGCGMILLKRLSDAIASGDRVLALIRSTAVNHDGTSSGLTVPNPTAQENLIRQALDAAKLTPHEIDYIEAHGTGTSLGDPIEMAAIGSVFRGRNRPLWIGSVKTNIGHLEGAAGIAGLIKAILALEHEELPPHLHFHEPNPHIPWPDLPVRIPVERTPWPRTERDRFAGVSSFGFSGTNAHVILQESPLLTDADAKKKETTDTHLLTISAMAPEALQELIPQYLTLLELDPGPRIQDICFTAAVGRCHFIHRVAVIGSDRSMIHDRLSAFVRGERCDGVWSEIPGNSPPASHVRHPDERWKPPADPRDWEAEWVRLAERYVAGDSIDWDRVYEGHGARRIALPTYPFQRRRYFLETSASARSIAADTSEPIGHPLLGKRVHTAAAAEITQFEVVLSPDQPGYLNDHRIGDTPVLPATAQLEMAVAAGRIATGENAVVLEHAAFQRPLVWNQSESRIVQTVLTPLATGYRFELFSRPQSAGQSQRAPQWTRHASGNVVARSEPCSPEPLVVADLLRQCPDYIAPDGINDRISQQGLQYGPAFRLLAQVHRGPNEVLSKVDLPEYLQQEAEHYQCHPALMDACLQSVAALIETEPGTMFLPTRLERLEIFSRPTTTVWSHARLRRTDPTISDRFTVDVDIFASDRQPVAQLEGLRLQRVERQFFSDAPRGHDQVCLYQVRWDELPVQEPPASEPPQRWLILADSQGLGEALSQRFSRRGQDCLLVYPGTDYGITQPPGDRPRHYQIRPGVAADYARLVEDSYRTLAGNGHSTGPIQGAVHLWSLDAKLDEAESFAQAHRLSCGSALQLIQAFLKKQQDLPDVWMITSAAQCLDDDSASESTLAQAPLSGFRRVCAAEHPELRCMHIDLDPGLQPAAQADLLLDELARPACDEQVAYRHGTRFVARLARGDAVASGVARLSDDPSSLLAGGTTMITGGLGGLGLHVARALADRGARHLVLVGRHGPRGNEQQAAIEQLRGSGVTVQVRQADIGNRQEVQRLLVSVHATLPALRGIVHAAGVLDDAALSHQDWSRFERVMNPKVAGAWHLHCLAKDLDFFIVFSSAAGLLGSPGQANYAAANAFLDALAAYRRSQGKPAASIAWGPWEVGMSARVSESAHARMSRLGLQPIRIAEGLATLGLILKHDELRVIGDLQPNPVNLAGHSALVAAINANWQKMASAVVPSRFWSDLAGQSEPAVSRLGIWSGELQATPAGNRMKKLTDFIRAEVATVLGWDSPKRVGVQQKLFDLGMDSITSVELQQRLEKNLGFPLPLTLAFDYPNVQALADFALKSLELDVAETNENQGDSAGDRDVVRLEGMTDEDIRALIKKEYEDLM